MFPHADRPVARHCSVCRAVYGGSERFCPLDGGAMIDADAADPLVGRIGGRYFLRRPIGRGGDREAIHRLHREGTSSTRSSARRATTG